MQFQRQKRGAGQFPITPEFTQVGDKIIASAPWQASGDGYEERFVVFTFRDGRIADVQGCASRREAERFVRRR